MPVEVRDLSHVYNEDSPFSAAALKGVKGQAETPDELIKLALRHMAQNM